MSLMKNFQPVGNSSFCNGISLCICNAYGLSQICHDSFLDTVAEVILLLGCTYIQKVVHLLV